MDRQAMADRLARIDVSCQGSSRMFERERSENRNNHREPVGRHQRPSTLKKMHAIYISLLVLAASLQPALSGIMGADVLAVGDWTVRVKCGEEFYNSFMFPPSSNVGVVGGSSSSKSNMHRKALNRLVRKAPVPQLFRTREFQCHLSLFSDGTFALRPVSLPQQGKESTVAGERNLMPLRGRWNVEANPYCITDRFYDNLKLESTPRDLVALRRNPRKNVGSKIMSHLKRHLSSSSPRIQPTDNTAHLRDDRVRLNRLSFQMCCRMSGRYSRPGRGYRTRARLTHGTLLLLRPSTVSPNNKNVEAKIPSSKTTLKRSVGASFSGERILQRGYVPGNDMD